MESSYYTRTPHTARPSGPTRPGGRQASERLRPSRSHPYISQITEQKLSAVSPARLDAPCHQRISAPRPSLPHGGAAARRPDGAGRTRQTVPGPGPGGPGGGPGHDGGPGQRRTRGDVLWEVVTGDRELVTGIGADRWGPMGADENRQGLVYLYRQRCRDRWKSPWTSVDTGSTVVARPWTGFRTST